MPTTNLIFNRFIDQATRPHPSQDRFYETGGDIIKAVTSSLGWHDHQWIAEWVGSRAKGTNVPWSDGDMLVKHDDENVLRVTKKMRNEFRNKVEAALQDCGFVRVRSQALFCATRFKYAVGGPENDDRNDQFEIDVIFADTTFAYPPQLEQGQKATKLLRNPEVKIAIKALKYLQQRRRLPKVKGIEVQQSKRKGQNC
ncbi:hypothetical protein HK102_003256 [Quaeritorhiza haematococci]|nr:hypothetical protein HK102_003256 [Quaeritorhiza haematococci]